MANNLYTTKTATLKATKADINKLDAKKMLLNGKNILDYISDSEFDSYDTRDPQLKNDELDIWNTSISLSDNGHIEVKPHVHGMLVDLDTGEITLEGITEPQCNTLKTAAKVIDGKVLGSNDEHIMYWQTDGLTDGNIMFMNCTNLESFSSDLSSLTMSYGMFGYCENLNSFSADLSSLTIGAIMFAYCSNISTFNCDLSSLTEGYGMFYGCTNLTTFTSNLSSLTNGAEMFEGCSNLTTFTSDLSSLTDGREMFFNCTNITTFTSNLSSLTSSTEMFSGCSNLKSFSSDLSSLTNAERMFNGCTNLTSFNANLSSLTNGLYMFDGCRLDGHSVANIIHTLPTHETSGKISIGIGYDDTEADALLFIQDCYYETGLDFLADFSAKNWTVSLYCNGRPTTTYNMRRGETLPVYTKLVEVIMPTDEKERKPHYAYTSADGSKFFNINCFHYTNGSTEGYDVFSSLEEAISTYNVTPKN